MTDAADSPTLEQLRKRAADLEIEGRSSMDREQLEDAIAAEEAAAGPRDGDMHLTGSEAAAALAETVTPPDSSPARSSGRPSLREVAEKQAASKHVRVIGADDHDQED